MTGPGSPAPCVIDQIELGSYDEAAQRSSCSKTSMSECDRQCKDGIAEACVEVAYALETDPNTEQQAQQAYAKACALGIHNACTNHAAYLYHSEASTPADLTCAARVFEATCEVGDPFGCGMRSLALLHGVGVAQDSDAALAHAGRTCQQYEFFACDALGRIYEARGDTAKAIVAFAKACETHYEDACAEVERLGASTKTP